MMTDDESTTAAPGTPSFHFNVVELGPPARTIPILEKVHRLRCGEPGEYVIPAKQSRTQIATANFARVESEVNIPESEDQARVNWDKDRNLMMTSANLSNKGSTNMRMHTVPKMFSNGELSYA